jgi:hypothetical protein
MENAKRFGQRFIDNWITGSELIVIFGTVVQGLRTGNDALLYLGGLVALLTIGQLGYGQWKIKNKRIAQLEEENRKLKETNSDLQKTDLTIEPVYGADGTRLDNLPFNDWLIRDHAEPEFLVTKLVIILRIDNLLGKSVFLEEFEFNEIATTLPEITVLPNHGFKISNRYFVPSIDTDIFPVEIPPRVHPDAVLKVAVQIAMYPLEEQMPKFNRKEDAYLRTTLIARQVGKPDTIEVPIEITGDALHPIGNLTDILEVKMKTGRGFIKKRPIKEWLNMAQTGRWDGE